MLTDNRTNNANAMTLFKSLFSKKIPQPIVIPPADTAVLNDQVEKYQVQVLQKFIKDREESITRLATWDIQDLDGAITDFTKELAYCKIVEGASMCNIFEEKLYQLNAAMELRKKNQTAVAV